MEHRKNQKRVDPFELYADDPERADRIVFGREPHKDRRGFLKGAGLAAMGAAVGAAAWLAAPYASQAADECGAAPAGGGTILCDENSYTPETDGNIVYELSGDSDYRIVIRGLDEGNGVVIDDDVDGSHDYFPARPNAVWIDHSGPGSLSGLISGIELTTTGESAGADQRGLNFTLYSDSKDISETRRDLSVKVENSLFKTYARAINVVHVGTGTVTVEVEDTRIRTTGPSGHGIVGWHDANGDVFVTAQRVDIETVDGYGVAGFVWNSTKYNQVPDPGDKRLVLDVRDSDIRVAGAGRGGLYGRHQGSGSVEILLSSSSVSTTGDDAYGMVIRHTDNTLTVDGPGNLDIAINFVDSQLATENAHAIVIDRADPDSSGANRIRIGPNSEVRAGGTGVGILVQGAAGSAASSTVTIDGLLAAESGLAVQHQAGDLDVHIRDSGRVEGVIINEQGYETIIRVGQDVLVRNNVILRSIGAAGPFDTTVGTTDVPGFSGFTFSSVFGPRAAVYEALPGILLRLNGQPGSAEGRMRAPETPMWLRLDAGAGSYEADRATVGAEFDVDRFGLEVGMDVQLDEGLTGTIGVRLVSGSADVSAPTGGGTIDASGYGLSAGLAWHGADGFYADGSLSATWFDLDAASDVRGTLKQDIGARIHSFYFEAGRRLVVDERTTLRPRAWLSRSDVSVDRFTDAVGARVSLADADRITGGVGGVIETEWSVGSGEGETLSLRGSLDVEKTLSGDETAVGVSGTKLTSKAPDNKVLLGAGASWHGDGFILGAEVRASGVGSKDRDLGGYLSLGITF